MPNLPLKVRTQRRPARRPPARTTIESKRTVGHHFFETMCPTAFLAPTLIAKTCSICTQPKHAFFLAQLALQGHRANGKKPLPGRVPGPKKGTKMVPKSGSFQKEFFCSVAKKSPKNWTGPCLSLNMVRRNRFIKWQTPARNAKSSFEGANPTPPSPATACQNDDRIETYSRSPLLRDNVPHSLLSAHSDC